MAKFSAPKRLVVEDFPAEQRSWMPKLLDPLNVFMGEVAQAFTKGIVLSDNFRGVIIEFSVVANQTYPLNFNLSSLKSRPNAVFIGSIAATDETSLSSPFSVVWSYDNGNLSYYFLGLDAAKQYSGKLIVLV